LRKVSHSLRQKILFGQSDTFSPEGKYLARNDVKRKKSKEETGKKKKKAWGVFKKS